MVVVARLHSGRYQVVEYTGRGFVVHWEGADGAYAQRRADRVRVELGLWELDVEFPEIDPGRWEQIGMN